MNSDDGHERAVRQLDRGQIKSIFRNLEYLDSGAADEAACALAALNAEQRAFVEHWRSVILRSDSEVARLFVRRAPRAFALMDRAGVEDWLLRALERFDQRGLGWAVEVLDGVERFAAERARSLTLEATGPLLSRFVTGLGGRELRLEAATEAHTDTETLFLPAELHQGREAGLRLYKALAVHHWAQTRHGTWHPAVLARLLNLSPAALARFAALERLRLDARIAAELPGLGRDLRALGGLAPPQGIWRDAARTLADPVAGAADSLDWLNRVADAEPPAPAGYHGVFRPRQVERCLRARLSREREVLRLRLGQLQIATDDEDDAAAAGERDERPRHRKPTEDFTLTTQSGDSGNVVVRLHWNEQPVEVPDDMRELLQSIHQDLGEIPPEYLDGIGRRFYDPEQGGGERTSDGIGRIDGDTARTFRYPEWDHTRNRFRPAYCTLREYTVEPGDPAFVAATRRKHHGLLKSIRRSFEAMANAPRLERRQPEGDDIDLDAAVEARVDARHGDEPSSGVYTRLRDDARSIAVLFMVDMSGSTKGWVNEAEREALVLLCEALETIGDRYAIHGFSGRTRLRVESYRIKTFDERYTEPVRARIAGIRPRAYTRMGTAIRHLGGLLQREPARHKLLITLSDGKPEDYGSYTGRYGIEDTRHALLELRRDGVHPFCITIDKEGGDYLPYMYGPANYTVIDRVDRLPLRVADIYRRLTS